MFKTIFYLYLFFIFNFLLLSQEIEFIATVDKNPAQVGDKITVSYTINVNASDFKGPNFKGFTVKTGPTQFQSKVNIGGKIRSLPSYLYVISADKIGNFKIDPASIKVDGTTYRSNSLQVKVLSSKEMSNQQNEQDIEKQRNLDAQALNFLKKNIILKVDVNKRNVYQGEQLIATYKLYINPQINPVNMQPKKLPVFEGFWAQDLNIEKLDWKKETLGASSYNTSIIKQVILFPQRSGKLLIDPYEFDFVVRLMVDNSSRKHTGNIFDEELLNDNYQDFNYLAKSDPISINVNSLPLDAPNIFSGAVGNINMVANINKNQGKTGEPLTLSLKLSGNGNFKLLEAPAIKFPPDFEIYEPKINDNTNLTTSGIFGSVNYEYIIIPKNPGEYKIDPIQFSYFDLTTNNYVSVQSQQFNLMIEKGNYNPTTEGMNGVRKEEVELIGKDIRFIKINSDKLSQYPKPFFNSLAFWLLLIAPFILLILLLLYRRKRLHEAQDILQFRTRKATKYSRKRLSSAKKLLKMNEQDKFYDEINKTLWGYLSDKLQLPTADLTKDNVRSILLNRNVSEELITKFLFILDEAEFARYAPIASNLRIEEIYNNVVDVITKMEGEIK